MESIEPASSIEKEKTKYGIQDCKTTRDGAMAHALCRKRGYTRSVVSSQGGRWKWPRHQAPRSEAQQCGQANVTPASGKETCTITRPGKWCYTLADLILVRLRNNSRAQEPLPRRRMVQSDLLPLVRFAEELELKEQEEQGLKTRVCEGRSDRVGKMCARPRLSAPGGWQSWQYPSDGKWLQ